MLPALAWYSAPGPVDGSMATGLAAAGELWLLPVLGALAVLAGAALLAARPGAGAPVARWAGPLVFVAGGLALVWAIRAGADPPVHLVVRDGASDHALEASIDLEPAAVAAPIVAGALVALGAAPVRGRLAPVRIAAPAALARAEPGWRTPLVAWATSRALVIVARRSPPAWPSACRSGASTRPSRTRSRLLGGWDTTWYLDVARHGYAHDTGQVGEVFTNLAFFPLLPGVMAAALAIGLNPFIAALVVSNLAFLGRPRRASTSSAPSRFGDEAAARATWALALLPTAAYASLAYTEGIVLACALGAALAGTRGRPGLAGLAAAAATLARPTGILVALLAGLLALRGPAAGRARRVALAVGPSLVALAAFLAWMAVARGSALLPFEAQHAWDRGQVGIGLVTAAPSEIAAGWHHIVSGTGGAAWHATIRDLAFLVALPLAAGAPLAQRGRSALPVGRLLGGRHRAAPLERDDHVDGPLRPAGLPAHVAARRLARGRAGPRGPVGGGGAWW